MSSQVTKKIELLDSVRGWAALSVLLFHTAILDIMPDFPGRHFAYYLQADRAAVLLFFVLSGYVIGLTNRQPWSAQTVKQYGWRRFIRIYPIYVIAILLGLAAVPQTSLTTVLGQLAFLQDSNPTNPVAVANLPGNQPLWSLHYEALFYLCFLGWWRWPGTILPSLLFCIVGAFGATAWPPAPAVIITHSVGAIFWLSGLLLAKAPASRAATREGPILANLVWLHAVYQFAPAYLLQGGLHIPNEYKAYLPIHDLCFLPGAVVVVALAAGLQPRFLRLLELSAGGMAIAGLAMILVAGKNLLDTRWAVSIVYLALGATAYFVPGRVGLLRLASIGGYSYALYVVHMPVLILTGKLFAPHQGFGPGLLAVAVAVGVIFPLAWWLEIRFQPWLRQTLTSRL